MDCCKTFLRVYFYINVVTFKYYRLTMKKFEFSSPNTVTPLEKTVFSGRMFYQVYKEAEFLKYNENIETILCKSHELRQKLKGVAPGEHIVINGIWLEKK